MLGGKTVVVTGGSLGIGFAVAKKCVHEGATAILAARNRADLERSLDALKGISKSDHAMYAVDVSDPDAVGRFAAWCGERFGVIHGLVNCAGVYGPIGKTTSVDIRRFVEAIQINFLGTVIMCRAFAPLLQSNTRKKIVNFSGGGAASPFPHYTAYATSKIAIVRFTENLALELDADGVDINCVAPGFVITRLHDDTVAAGKNAAGEAFFENTRKQIETGGVPPEKAADLTAFLLSPESDGITGKFISAPWDPWKDESFRNLLRSDRDFATLRRIDNKTYFKKA
jgi:3-oxoacyl-[acyl-carrier protein] reductase